MWLVDHVIDAAHSCRRYCGCVQTPFAFGAGELPSPCFYRFIDFVVTIHAAAGALKIAFKSPVFLIDDLCQRVPLLVVLDGNRAPIVSAGAAVDSLRRDGL